MCVLDSLQLENAAILFYFLFCFLKLHLLFKIVAYEQFVKDTFIDNLNLAGLLKVLRTSYDMRECHARCLEKRNAMFVVEAHNLIWI